jgi:ABC-2 type transport system permease protein
MGTLIEVIRFELNYRKSRPATYIYFGIIFLFCFLGVTIDGASIGGASGQIKENAPLIITRMSLLISIFLCLIASAVMGVAILRDFEHNTEAIMFSTPMSKFSYLMGRFIGSFIVLIFIGSGTWTAFAIADFMWWRDAEKLLPFNFWHFLQPFLVFVVPNLFFSGSLLFMTGALSRKSLVLYTQGFAMLVLYLISRSLLRSIDNREIAALLDPFGIISFNYMVQYWTPSEQNSLLVPLSGHVLYNRLIWTGVGLAGLVITYFGFSFNVVRDGLVRRKASAKAKAKPVNIPLPVVHPVVNFGTRVQQFFRMTWFYASSVLVEVPFLGIVICGLLLLAGNATNLGALYGTNAYPTTYYILNLIEGSFSLFFVVLVVFYSGELVWRERSVKIDQIVDAAPIADFTMLIAKCLALMIIYSFLIIMLILCGVIIQASYGYYKFELPLYFGTMFTQTMSVMTLFTFVSIFVQVMVNNKFMGYAVVIAFFIVTSVLSAIGLEHVLFEFGGTGLGTYSDMNFYGHFVSPFTWSDAYWFGFTGFLFAVAVFFSVRGTESVINIRWKAGKLRLQRTLVTFGISALVIFLCSGFYIFYNTNILNEYDNSDDQKKTQAEYEKQFKKYEFINQPKIVESNLRVELYPATRDYTAEGFYWLKNKSKEPINEIHIQYYPDKEYKFDRMTFDRKADIKERFEKFGYLIYSLDQPLQAGDSIKFDYKFAYTTRGFKSRPDATPILFNGTFLNNQYLPSIGYSSGFELNDDDDRKDNDLKPKERMLERDDPRGLEQNLFGDDADQIRFEIVLGTEPDQIAIAPGYLERTWDENGRKYFHYKMDAPMCNFYSIISARYEIKRDKWNDVNLEIYYHKGHEYNLDKMMEGMKDALTYYTKNFGPYQFRQLRIMEFPRYASFAQSFANTIPYSEGIGFIAKIDDPDKDIDYVYYVTAHEVAHQWWGHQAVEARVKGNAMLSESMSQYSALMVMKHKFPRETIERYLKYELDTYLSGRRSESKKEQPLEFVEGQGYIHYQKASLVFFALQDYITEDSVNAAFRRYLDKRKFKEAPYPTSLDLLTELRKVTPDSLKPVLTDLFATITLFENKADSATYEEVDSLHYVVSLTTSSEKMRADSAGMETPIGIDDWIDIGVYGKNKAGKDSLLYLRKHHITGKENTYTITVSQKPLKAGIDPLHKLIDRHSSDNTKGLVRKTKETTGKPPMP